MLQKKKAFWLFIAVVIFYPSGAHWCLESTELNDFYFFWIGCNEMKSVRLNLQWSGTSGEIKAVAMMEEVQIFH